MKKLLAVAAATLLAASMVFIGCDNPSNSGTTTPTTDNSGNTDNSGDTGNTDDTTADELVVLNVEKTVDTDGYNTYIELDDLIDGTGYTKIEVTAKGTCATGAKFAVQTMDETGKHPSGLVEFSLPCDELKTEEGKFGSAAQWTDWDNGGAKNDCLSSISKIQVFCQAGESGGWAVQNGSVTITKVVLKK